MAQQYIGRYEVIAELGRGGMATVYHAYDPDFERDVAIKVMPREFLHLPDFRTRFQREARTIANLEHDAIIPVYELGEHDDLPYLIMRYMAGGPLADRIDREPITVPEVIRLFERIAPAIDKAHAQGFVHRDLKPDNILFDADDNAFIADFGIAKLMHSTSQLTGSGALVGTPAYMSPEQIQDKGEVDHRSDLYSLGVILYEALTGQTPFIVDSSVGYFSAHLNDPVPDILNTNPNLPPIFAGIIHRAMAKDKDDRYQSAADFAADVVRALAPDAYDDDSDTPVVEPARATRTVPLALIGGLVLVLVVAGVLLSGALRGSPDPEEVVVQVTATSDLVDIDPPDAAPTPTPESEVVPDFPDDQDGWIIFDSNRDATDDIYYNRRREIYKIRADGEQLTRLTLTESDNYDPAWSPDGTQIAFASDRDGDTELYLMDSEGGNIRRLTDSPGIDEAPDWSPDGTQIVFVSERDGNPEIYMIDVDGSGTIRLTDDSARDESPAWSPDGNQIAFSSSRNGFDQIWIKDLASGREIQFTLSADPALRPAWSPDGLFIAYDAFPATSNPGSQVQKQAVESGIIIELGLSYQARSQWMPAWAPDGHWLVYIDSRRGSVMGDTFATNIRVVDPENPVPVEIFSERSTIQNPDWWAPPADEDTEPDSSSEDTLLTELAGTGEIVFSTFVDPPNLGDVVDDDDIVKVDADGRDRIRLTLDSARDWNPAWSPDGSQIAFSSDRDGDDDIYIMNADGSDVYQLFDLPGDQYDVDWSPDGTQLLYVADTPNTQFRNIYVVNADGTNETRLTDDQHIYDYPAWSPDGSQIAFSSDRQETMDIYVMDQDGANISAIAIDTQADLRWPTWSPDGAQLVYEQNQFQMSPESVIFVIDIETHEKAEITPTLSFNIAGMSWSPDGEYIAYSGCSFTPAVACHLWVMRADGSDSERIVSVGGAQLPDWKP